MTFQLAITLSIVALIAVDPTTQKPDWAPLATEQSALPLIEQMQSTKDTAARLVLIDRILAILIQPTPMRGGALCERASMLDDLHRETEAGDAFAECRVLRPDDPQPALALAVHEAEVGRLPHAAALLIEVAKSHPRALDVIDLDYMNGILRKLGYTRQEKVGSQLIDALVTAGYQRSNVVAFSAFAQSAIQHRLRDGDVGGAVALLPSIVSPRSGLQMLIDRRYAPIWADVERWAGNDLAVQRRAYLIGARANFEQNGTSVARLAYANALVQTGNRDRAIAMIDAWLAEPMPSAEQESSEAWSRNMALLASGRWLAQTGRRTEAIKSLQEALRRGGEPDSGLANIVPALVVQQMLALDYAGAKSTLDHFTPVKGTMEDAATAGYFVALRACVAQGLGKRTEAVDLARQVRTLYGTNLGAADYAMDCVGSPDEQAKYWIERAHDPERRSGALIDMVSARYRLKRGLPVLSLDEAALRKIAVREDVRRAYDELGRVLPESYEPALDDFNGVPVPSRSADMGPVA